MKSPQGLLKPPSLRNLSSSPLAKAARKPLPVAPPRRAQPHQNLPHNPLPRSRSINPRALTAFAVATLFFSTYGTYLYVSTKNTIENSKNLSVPVDVSDRYQETAATFDADINTTESIMGIGAKRKELVQRAHGDVLEVACGTGRNMAYYLLGEKRGTDADGRAAMVGCKSLTFVDKSFPMTAIAKRKFNELHPDFKLAAFHPQDAMDPIPPPPQIAAALKAAGDPRHDGFFPKDQPIPEKFQFDTIVQTMGLCSHPDPVAYLVRLAKLVKPEQGEILLLEHGRSYYGWVNKLLDDLAPAHAMKHGCWWNRDIEEVVRESGLEVVESKRWHWGTTYRFVLRVNPNKKEDDGFLKEKEGKAEGKVEGKGEGKGEKGSEEGKPVRKSWLKWWA
ncbi:hypothetical protein FQN50_003654 [Emmonsiellopsis sp. PD_5]|nr:hypothetical protein FQN50_003654 [Emmonsiellopsis sp. PD_5]